MAFNIPAPSAPNLLLQIPSHCYGFFLSKQFGIRSDQFTVQAALQCTVVLSGGKWNRESYWLQSFSNGPRCKPLYILENSNKGWHSIVLHCCCRAMSLWTVSGTGNNLHYVFARGNLVIYQFKLDCLSGARESAAEGALLIFNCLS